MNPNWQIVEQEQPGLSVKSCRCLGEGWNACAYLVNEEFVFRFPKRAGSWVELRREMVFLGEVKDHLPLNVPHYLAAVPESPAAANGYAIYRYLPGGALDVHALSEKEREATADALAAFLNALHAFKPTPALLREMPKEDARAALQEYRDVARARVVPHVTQSQALALSAECDRYEKTLTQSSESVVLHADLSRDHILAQHQHISGVLDFGDVNLGDADYDFAYICLDWGWDFAQAVARRYGHANQDQLRCKLRYFSIVDQIDTIAYGQGMASEGQERCAWNRLRQLLDSAAIDTRDI